MTLGSGEQLAMSNSTLKLLFETGRLQHASPDILTHCVSYKVNTNCAGMILKHHIGL